MGNKKKVIDAYRESMKKRQKSHQDANKVFFITPDDGQSKGPAIDLDGATTALERGIAAARRYNETILDVEPHYRQMEPLGNNLLVRHFLYVPKGKLIQVMPKLVIVDNSKPMNVKHHEVDDPFPFTRLAVVVSDFEPLGLRFGDIVVTDPPRKNVTQYVSEYEGIYFDPDCPDPRDPFSYAYGDNRHYGYRIIQSHQVRLKLKSHE